MGTVESPIAPSAMPNLPSELDAFKSAPVSGARAGREVLERLLAENRIFASAAEPTVAPSTPTLRHSLASEGQAPSAVVVACSDSRVSPEILFRAKVGDVFVIRTAGNIADDLAVLASIEYAVLNLKSSLVLVLGHEQCGAVSAAISYKENPESCASLTPSLKQHVENIANRIDLDEVQHLETGDRVSAVVGSHTVKVVHSLRAASALVREYEERGDILVVPAVYDLAGGAVRVLDDQ